MKKFKKLISIMLVAVMALAMSMTAFAADATATYNLTIKTVANHTYKIYQLATGNVSSDGETLSNIKVGSSAKGDTTVDKITALTKYGNGSADLSDAAWALIDAGKPVKTVTGDGTDITNSLASGYYVVWDEVTNAEAAPEGDSVSRVMVDLVKNTTMTPKTISIEPDKKIVEGDALTDTNEASMGDRIEYQLKGTLPSMAGYKGFKYVLVDTMSTGLTPDAEELFAGNTLKGTVNGKEAEFKVTSVSERDNNGNIVVRIALVDAYSWRNEPEGSDVIVNIHAYINENAPVAPSAIPNKVKIDYSNNPNYDYNGEPDFDDDDPKGTTPEITVNTYTTSLTINKVVGGTNEVLTGAEFKLTSENSAKVGYVTGQEYVASDNGTWYKLKDGAYTETAPNEDNDNRYDGNQKYELKDVEKVTYDKVGTEAQAFVDATGKVVFTGLGVGDYILSEVTTPDGYNTMADVHFTVNWTKDGGFTVEMGEGTPEGFEITVADKAVLSTTVPNYTGTELPSTGGIGTTIFYIVGAILVIGAGVILVAKKRMSHE